MLSNSRPGLFRETQQPVKARRILEEFPRLIFKPSLSGHRPDRLKSLRKVPLNNVLCGAGEAFWIQARPPIPHQARIGTEIVLAGLFAAPEDVGEERELPGANFAYAQRKKSCFSRAGKWWTA